MMVVADGGGGELTGITRSHHALMHTTHLAIDSKVADWQTDVTNWPSSLTITASWDVALAREWGAAMGEEQRGKGMQVCS